MGGLEGLVENVSTGRVYTRHGEMVPTVLSPFRSSFREYAARLRRSFGAIGQRPVFDQATRSGEIERKEWFTLWAQAVYSAAVPPPERFVYG